MTSDTAALYRGTWAEVNLDAIRFNVRVVTQYVNSRAGAHVDVMAVVKANGYGHGAVPVAEAAIQTGATWLGVATLGEAQELRQAGIKVPVLVLGYVSGEFTSIAVDHGVTLTAVSVSHAKELARLAPSTGRPLDVHIKVDSGMTRLGVRTPEELRQVISALTENPAIRVAGLFTHFAQSDGDDGRFSRLQLEVTRDMFDVAKRALGDGHRLMLHAANSGAILQLPDSYFDMVRLGISLYGVAPSRHLHESPAVPLRQALKLYSRIVMQKEVPSGTPIGYGSTYVTRRPTRIATVPIGYGDGLPRTLSNQGSFRVHGQLCPILGRVCMDYTMIDVSHVADAREGDSVVIYDQDLLLESAELAQTIPYELLCAVAPRVPRKYVGRGSE